MAKQVNRGNKRVSSEIEQKIFDLWLENSEISVDRRDGRDVVNITAKEYASRYGGVVCQHLIYGSKKRNVDIIKAPQYVSHKSVRQMVSICEENIGLKMLIGTIFRLRPFFVCVPNEREKLECLCLQRVFSSITDYFSNGKVCNTARNGYPSFNCINGDCPDCNGIINPYNYELKNNDTVTYYQFECKETGKVKNGKPCK